MTTPELPSDDWHWYVFKNNSCACNECGKQADLSWAWSDMGSAGATDAGVVFATRAVEQLKSEGWQLIYGRPYCRACAEKMGG